MNDPQVLIRIDGKAGRIMLNRPGALNALSYEMVKKIMAALEDWQDNPDVSCVLIEGAGERAFCAGGDIEQMYQAGRKGNHAYGTRFWRDEYRLNAFIAAYPKPYAALMHGFVMGGGVGVSAHGSHRIVTDTSLVAMPECGIGLIPDVGGTHILGRAPGALGEFIALTGYKLNAQDAIYAGFADYFVPQENLAALAEKICASGDVAVVADFRETPTGGMLKALQGEIDKIFALDTVSEIIKALEGAPGEWATKALKALYHAAPLSLVCTLRMVRAARARNNLVATLAHELRFTSRASEHSEFLEGIRAAIIDKDRAPKWRYAKLDDIPKELIDKMLAPVADA